MEDRIVLPDDLILNPVAQAVIVLRDVIISGLSEFDSLKDADFSERDLLLVNYGRNYGAIQALNMILERFQVKDGDSDE